MDDKFWKVKAKHDEDCPPLVPGIAERPYADVAAYRQVIINVWLDNFRSLSEEDLNVLMWLFKKKTFTLADVAAYPRKVWGYVRQRKTIEHLTRNGWIRIKSQKSMNNKRIYSFTPEGTYQMFLLFKALYLLHPIGNTRIPVSDELNEIKSYRDAIREINKIVKKNVGDKY